MRCRGHARDPRKPRDSGGAAHQQVSDAPMRVGVLFESVPDTFCVPAHILRGQGPILGNGSEHAKDALFPQRTMARAVEEIGVVRVPLGFGQGYSWALPPSSPSSAPIPPHTVEHGEHSKTREIMTINRVSPASPPSSFPFRGTCRLRPPKTRLSAPAEDASEDAKPPLALGNLASWHLGKNKAKDDDKTRFPREGAKFISLKGNMSPSAPQDAYDHLPEDDRDYSAGNPDEAVEAPA